MQSAVPKPTKTAAITKALPQGDAQSWLNWHFELEKREKSAEPVLGNGKFPFRERGLPLPPDPLPHFSNCWRFLVDHQLAPRVHGSQRLQQGLQSRLLWPLPRAGAEWAARCSSCQGLPTMLYGWEVGAAGSLVTPGF